MAARLRGEIPRTAEYRDKSRPSLEVRRGDMARLAILAAYGPNDAVRRVRSEPDQAAIYVRHDGGSWLAAKPAEADSFGSLSLIAGGDLAIPAVAIPLPLGVRTTEAAIVWTGGSPILTSQGLYTCGITPDGKPSRVVEVAGLTKDEMTELGFDSIPVAMYAPGN